MTAVAEHVRAGRGLLCKRMAARLTRKKRWRREISWTVEKAAALRLVSHGTSSVYRVTDPAYRVTVRGTLGGLLLLPVRAIS